MGVLVPEDFEVSAMADEAERRVVEACVHGLSDGWLVLPQLRLKVGTRDHELDVVLVHERYGVLDVEVKGHQPELRQGTWYAHGSRMAPQPPEQAHKNAYALRSFLRTRIAGLSQLKVPFGVALPNAERLDGHLGSDLKPEQVITGPMLGDMADAVEQLALMWATTQYLDGDEVQQIIDVLRPDARFTWDGAARQAFARRRLDDLCAGQVRALETLDRNRRALVLGAAGTGKTRLAEGWARRAVVDGQRVLVTCYNDPLADAIAARLGSHDALTVGPFLKVALGLEGMAPLDVPPDAGRDWWTYEAPAHLERHWGGIVERFDTIVVDEGQDFDPRWLGWLERLLDPDGSRRLLVVADPAQELYPRGFEVPGEDDGWATCELVANCRNAQQVARLLRRHLGGAPAPAVAPEAVDVRFVPVPPGDAAATAAAVGGELRWLLDDEGRDPGSVAVLTFASALRDRLHGELGLVRWEERAAGRVLGENVHRVKGLERDTVVLATDDPAVADELLYVGVSRAVSELVVVAPSPLGERLGLA